jgi:hypothetical protein
LSVLYDITSDFLTRSNFRSIHAGDDYDHKFTAVFAGVEDLTGAKIWFTIKAEPTDSDAEAKLAYTSDTIAQIEIVDPPNSKFVIHLKGSDTALLAGVLSYDIQAKLSSGKIVTLARGVIEFLNNLTQATS